MRLSCGCEPGSFWSSWLVASFMRLCELVKMGEEERNELLLKSIAEKICASRLEVPALFFLDMHRPLTALFHTATLFLQPVAAPLFGAERVQALERVLADKNNVDKLLTLIENYSAEKPSRNNA